MTCTKWLDLSPNPFLEPRSLILGKFAGHTCSFDLSRYPQSYSYIDSHIGLSPFILLQQRQFTHTWCGTPGTSHETFRTQNLGPNLGLISKFHYMQSSYLGFCFIQNTYFMGIEQKVTQNISVSRTERNSYIVGQ